MERIKEKRRKKLSFWTTKTFKKRTRVTFYAKPKKKDNHPYIEDVRVCHKCRKRINWLSVKELKNHWRICPHGRPESIWTSFVSIRPEILRFATRMEEVMSEKDKTKGDSWLDIPEFDLYELLKKEFEEIENGDEKEYADVANFCMMLWNREMFGPKGRGESSGLIEKYVEEWERLHGSTK